MEKRDVHKLLNKVKKTAEQLETVLDHVRENLPSYGEYEKAHEAISRLIGLSYEMQRVIIEARAEKNV